MSEKSNRPPEKIDFGASMKRKAQDISTFVPPTLLSPEEALIEYWLLSPVEICHLVMTFVGKQLAQTWRLDYRFLFPGRQARDEMFVFEGRYGLELYNLPFEWVEKPKKYKIFRVEEVAAISDKEFAVLTPGSDVYLFRFECCLAFKIIDMSDDFMSILLSFSSGRYMVAGEDIIQIWEGDEQYASTDARVTTACSIGKRVLYSGGKKLRLWDPLSGSKMKVPFSEKEISNVGCTRNYIVITFPSKAGFLSSFQILDRSFRPLMTPAMTFIEYVLNYSSDEIAVDLYAPGNGIWVINLSNPDISQSIDCNLCHNLLYCGKFLVAPRRDDIALYW